MLRYGNCTQAFEWYQFGWPSVKYNPDFKVTIIERQITQKWYNKELYLQWPTNLKSYIIYWTAPFFNDLERPCPRFQDHPILWCWIYHKWYKIHSFNLILIGLSLSHALLNSVILNDLAKYSMTRSVAWSLCDSWASCFVCCLISSGGKNCTNWFWFHLVWDGCCVMYRLLRRPCD